MAKVIIAGGGTGGHIFPAVAIAQALQRHRPELEILFVGARGKMEMDRVPEAGFRIIGLDIAGFNRSHLWKNWSLPFKLWKSMQKAKAIIRDFKPDVVIGVGGYASFPVLRAAQRAGIPTVIQEQNSYAGKTNKILGRKARAVCVAYPGMEAYFPAEKIILTGNPVRKTIAGATISREEGLAVFGLSPERKTLLVVGGSLGARAVNEAIAAGLDELSRLGLQLIWQTGSPYYETAKDRAASGAKQVKVHRFIGEMEYAYAAADIVISRAGALAAAELCIQGKPVIFVPYPYAAEDHQTSNARALVDHNAAMMVADVDAGTALIPKIKTLLQNPEMQEIMSREISARAIRDADDRIAATVLDIIKRNQA